MNSQRIRVGFEFTCDCCGQVWEPPRLGIGSSSRDFCESWDLAKEDGWRAVKVRSRAVGRTEDWEHRCVDCA